MECKVTERLRLPAYVRDYRPVPFWSWNDRLDKKRLCDQIEWMHAQGIGGFFMHARGGLLTEYLGESWMECCDACCEKAAELDMDAYMYDENGWPSGFVGGKLLENPDNRDRYLTHAIGDFDPDAWVCYELTPERAVRVQTGQAGKQYLNVYCRTSVSTVDILNPAVTEQFLDCTHRAYKARYGQAFPRKIKGFFTDEPQYYRWETAYTPLLADYFRAQYGQDILDSLGLLFVEKEGYAAFRYRYWHGMQTLFLQNFARKLYDFCQTNGVAFTGHCIQETSLGEQMECCGGIMPFYAYQHIPGIDWLGRGTDNLLAAKQVCSVAAQTGKNRVLTETFGCCGWDVTPRELKQILDWQYIDGVNLLCHHLLPSSEYGQRKRDYPQHYTPLNPWIDRCFKRFNDCYTRLGALIGHSVETVDVCVLQTVTSAYIDFDRHAPADGVAAVDDALTAALQTLNRAHVPHHLVDETLLRDLGSVQDGRLVCGQCRYRYWLLPSLTNLSSSTYALLQAFLAAGGNLLLLGDAPRYLDGVPHVFDDLRSTCTLAQICAAQPYTVDNPRLRSAMRTGEDGPFVMLINPTQEAQNFTLTFGGATSVRYLDTDAVTLSEPRPLSGTLRAGQSAVLYPCDRPAIPLPTRPTVRLNGPLRVVRSTPNTLMLDTVRVALDGQPFGDCVPLAAAFAQLLESRYRGKLRLRYTFDTRICPAELKLYAEDMNTRTVEINGRPVTHIGTLPHEPMVQIYDIAPFVRRGKNEITVTLDYYQDDSVYYALFGEGVTESLRNCMAYNTALESVYLVGDFGAYPVNLREGQTDCTAVCDGFILDAPKKELRDFVTDGYPTLAGDITLETEIECDQRGCILEIGGRWQTADVEVDGKSATLLFDTALDISDMVRAGKNTVRVTLTTSLRNLLGPHHFAPCDEPTAVGPHTFELTGSWKDGKSDLYRASYALVRTRF